MDYLGEIRYFCIKYTSSYDNLSFMLVIGIAGGAGSGKTTVVNKILEAVSPQDVAVLSQDSYYRDSSDVPVAERQKINVDHPDSIEFDLLAQHVAQLKKGKSIEQPT